VKPPYPPPQQVDFLFRGWFCHAARNWLQYSQTQEVNRNRGSVLETWGFASPGLRPQEVTEMRLPQLEDNFRSVPSRLSASLLYSLFSRKVYSGNKSPIKRNHLHFCVFWLFLLSQNKKKHLEFNINEIYLWTSCGRRGGV
jgi:hypothetical protein